MMDLTNYARLAELTAAGNFAINENTDLHIIAYTYANGEKYLFLLVETVDLIRDFVGEPFINALAAHYELDPAYTVDYLHIGRLSMHYIHIRDLPGVFPLVEEYKCFACVLVDEAAYKELMYKYEGGRI